MKIFDYTSGKKGQVIDNLPIQDATSGCFMNIDNQPYLINMNVEKVDLFGVFNCDFAKKASIYDHKKMENVDLINVDNLKKWGVEAVIYCSGEWSQGEDKYWQWHVTATPEWVKKAVQQGWVTLTKQ